MEDSNKGPGFAKQEYEAVRPEIEALLERCYGVIIYAYEELVADGRLTMAYSTFLKYVRADGFISARMKKAAGLEPLNVFDEMKNIQDLDPGLLGPDFGCDLKTVHQTLVDIGVVGFGYSDFCDYFPESHI